MFGQLSYLVGEAFRGWRQHRSVILPSLVTIFLCSLLLCASVTGVAGAVRLRGLADRFYEVEAFLPTDDSVAVADAQSLALQMREVGSAQWRSPAEAAQVFRERFGSEMMELAGDSILPGSLLIHLLPEERNPAALRKVVGNLERSGRFESVRSDSDLLVFFADHGADLLFWPAAATVFLLLVLGMIVGNAVRLTLLSRQLLVENMKYAGGSSFFIQFPFVLEGGLQGFLGAGASVVLWWWGFSAALASFGPAAAILLPPLWLGVLVVVGVTATGAVSSLRTVSAFLAGK